MLRNKYNVSSVSFSFNFSGEVFKAVKDKNGIKVYNKEEECPGIVSRVEKGVNDWELNPLYSNGKMIDDGDNRTTWLYKWNNLREEYPRFEYHDEWYFAPMCVFEAMKWLDNNDGGFEYNGESSEQIINRRHDKRVERFKSYKSRVKKIEEEREMDLKTLKN